MSSCPRDEPCRGRGQPEDAGSEAPGVWNMQVFESWILTFAKFEVLKGRTGPSLMINIYLQFFNQEKGLEGALSEIV